MADPTPLSQDILSLQARILRHLSPDIPQREASEYFTDLQLVAALIVMTWPEALHLIPHSAGMITDRYLRHLAA